MAAVSAARRSAKTAGAVGRGGGQRKSTTGPHTLTPSPPLRPPRCICGQRRSSGTTGARP